MNSPTWGGRPGRGGLTASLRVAVVDGHPYARMGVAAVLDRSAATELVATAADIVTLAEHTGVAPEVVVLEPRLSTAPSGAAAVAAARRLGYRVVVLTGLEQPDRLREVVEAQPHGVIHKSGDTAELWAALHAAAEGRVFLSPVVRAKMRTPTVSLTATLDDVRLLLAQGHDNATIARERGVSLGTVKNQIRVIRNAYSAAGVEIASRTDLCNAAARRL